MVFQWLLTVLGSAGVAALLLAAVAFLLRGLITERLGRAVAHEYEAKLEALRLQNEKVLDALREARAERESLRSLALSSLTTFQAATIERRIAAIETLWRAFQETRDAIPYYVHVLDMVGYAQKNIGPRLHEELRRADIARALEPTRAPHKLVTSLRPFLGERLFSLYWAGQALLGTATSSTIASYQRGEVEPWYGDDHSLKLLTSVLDSDELTAFHSLRTGRLAWLVRLLETKLMSEVATVISGTVVATDSLSTARTILEAAAAAETPTQMQ